MYCNMGYLIVLLYKYYNLNISNTTLNHINLGFIITINVNRLLSVNKVKYNHKI